MAGIGFELRKMFNSKGLIPGIRAWIFSAVIVVGPTLLCIIMLTILQLFLKNVGVAQGKRDLFSAVIIYSFMFSLILTSGLTMILSRYISDKLYNNKEADILPSLKGAVTICMVIGGILGIFFYHGSPLRLTVKFAAFVLFMELNILWLQMVYVSALRDYSMLVKGFFIGIASGVFLSYGFVVLLKVDSVTSGLLSIDIGFFIVLVFFSGSIQSFFKIKSNKYFHFLQYIGKYPSLFFINLFYISGLYIHNFIYWIGDSRVEIEETFIFAPFYDISTFWAFLSVMPAMVIFVVFSETSLYEKLRIFFGSICSRGMMDTINQSKDEMISSISLGLRHVMIIQSICSILCLVLSMVFLPLAEISSVSRDIFDVLVIGDYAFIIMFICITILLYFDDRKGALLVVTVFVLSNVIFTGLTVFLGRDYYGFGFMVAAFLSLIVGLMRLNFLLKNIYYFIFCYQPITPGENGINVFRMFRRNQKNSGK